MSGLKIAVIGAGIAGLATAALLARDGHEVRVLERNDSIGGRAGQLTRDGFSFDTGPSWYLMPEVYEHFFELMGTSVTERLRLSRLDPSYRVFGPPAGDAGPVTVTPQGVTELFAAREAGGARRWEAYLASARRARDLAERHFLYNPYTSLRSVLQPEVLGALPELARLLGTSLHGHVGRRFVDPVLRQILGYPSIFLGATPRTAPAIYHMMSSLDLGDGVLYPAGGFWAVVRAIADVAAEAGARVHTGCEVTAITTAHAPGGRTRRMVTGYQVRREGGGSSWFEADAVVSAADLHHTETRLLSSRDREHGERWWSRATSGPGAVLVNLGVRGRIEQLPHHALFFTPAWERDADRLTRGGFAAGEAASLYVGKPSETDPGVAPGGHENLFVLVPVPADPAGGRGGPDGTGDPAVERVADTAISQIAAWAAIPDLAERVVVRHTTGPTDFAERYHSWRGGMLGPAHTLRQSAMFRRRTASGRVNGLYFAGSTTSPGVGVPMCLISAELVLKGIRGDRSAGPVVP